MFNIPLNVMSNTTQRILSQSNNISYSARGVVRVNATPDDRKADYLFRDFYMVLVTAYLTELGFRGLETMYTIPLMTKALDLHRLSELYPGARNHARLPEVLRGYVLGSLVKSDSITLVPELMKRMQDAQKGPMSEAERKQAELLINHLHKRLNYADYVHKNLVASGQLSADDAKHVLDGMKKLSRLQGGQVDLMGVVQDVLKKPVAERPEALKKALSDWDELFKLAGQDERTLFRQVAGNMESTLGQAKPGKKALKTLAQQMTELFEKTAARQDDNLQRLGQTVLKEHPLKDKLTQFIREGVESKATLSMLQRIQKSGTWPKMITSVALSFVFYGMIANWFDVKVLQPWQDKLVKKRGHSKDVVAPSYVALLPGIGVLVAGLSEKVSKKIGLGFLNQMGYLGRFALVGLAALLTYSAATVALIKARLAKTDGQYEKPPETSRLESAPRPEPKEREEEAEVQQPEFRSPLPSQQVFQVPEPQAPQFIPGFQAQPLWQAPYPAPVAAPLPNVPPPVWPQQQSAMIPSAFGVPRRF